MRTLELNLASRPFRNNTLLWLSLALAVLVLGLVSYQNYERHARHVRLYADLQTHVSQFDADRRDLENRGQSAYARYRQIDITAIEAQAIKANEFIRWKAFSWTRLFNRLQDVQPYDVQMTSIRPVFRKKRVIRGDVPPEDDTENVPVTVEGLAKTLGDFFEFERALMDDVHFSRIEPEATDTDDFSNETVFQLRFMYNPNPDPIVEPEPETDPEHAGELQGGDATPDGAERAAGDPRLDGRVG